jgi:hypothetical protein
MTGQGRFSGSETFSGRASLPPGALTELAALRLALPGYEVIITSRHDRYRFEAVRRRGQTGPWCVISSDPADLWRELPAAS